MTKFLTLFILLAGLSSCVSFKNPELKSMDGYSFDGIEGNQVKFTVKATVYNPNFYTLKVKPSKVDVYAENQLYGTLNLTKTQKMKRKKDTKLEVPLRFDMADGAMMGMMLLMRKDKIKVKLDGKVKGGVYFISKKFPVKYENTISPKELGLKNLMKF
jgi:LEA14-like dessication related protein